MPRKPAVNYRSFRFSKLNNPEFRHLRLLVFWPIFGLLFYYAERLSGVSSYFPVYSTLDDLIPLCEYFLIPYLFWFLYLIGMHIYTLFYDIPAFRKLMLFIIISYSVTLLIYLVFPNCQELRPAAFERDNVFTRILAHYYLFDTNTNVCPSLHVIGSVAVWCASWHIKPLQTPAWKIAFSLSAVLISISTVFLKQHSIVDIFAAIPVCLLAYRFSFGRRSLTKT